MTVRESDERSSADLRHAREAGRAEAEAAELRLLLEESLAREQRWMEKALRAEKAIEEVRLSEQQLSLWRSLNLEEELEKVRVGHMAAATRAAEAETAFAALQVEREQARRREERLLAEIARFSAYHRAVESSKAWRLIQLLRGLVGKRW